MDEQEIIRRAKEQDHASFEILVNRYKSVVEKFAFQFGIKSDQIPDIVQETFIRVYQNLERYNRGKFSTWLYQVTLNIARDAHRKNKRNKNVIHKAKRSAELVNPAHYYFENDAYVLLHQAVQQLEEKYRMPLVLFYFHEQTYDEIAAILKIRTPAVKSRMYRGRGKLKQIYKELEKEEGDSHGRQTIG